ILTQAADVAETTLKNISQGQGVAIVEYREKNILELSSNKRTSKTDKFWIEFLFKGDFSRADKYEFVNGKRGQLIDTYISTPDEEIGYSNENKVVHIQSGKKPFLLLPPMGEDFRPEYLVILGHNIKIPELLKDIANRKYRLNITKIESAKDTLTILGYLQEKGVNENLTIILDSSSMLPKQVVAHHHSSDNQRLDHNYQANWKFYGEMMYLKSLTYETGDGIGAVIIKIDIQDFNSAINIDNAKFRLDSINLLSGTHVYDLTNEISWEVP
ncbi:MAG: hypothetical protein GX554_01740, partial [Elusimicrobia bacterium]|nr:hypothetical protein [Elusimicrobiota bacterium]